MKIDNYGAKNATPESCFSLFGPHQCSAALGGPATSIADLRHQGAWSPKALVGFVNALKTSSINPI